jgi:hypothetical protein
MQVISGNGDLLFATEHGYGKRVSIDDFRVAHRGGVGVRTIPTTKRNGTVIGLVLVTDKSTVLLIDEAGKIIRLSPTEIRTMGRQAKGVRLIRLEADQRLAAVVAFDESEGSDDTHEGATHDSAAHEGGDGAGTSAAGDAPKAASVQKPRPEDDQEDEESGVVGPDLDDLDGDDFDADDLDDDLGFGNDVEMSAKSDSSGDEDEGYDFQQGIF